MEEDTAIEYITRLDCRVRGNYRLTRTKGANTVIFSGYTTREAADKLLLELLSTQLFSDLRVQKFDTKQLNWLDVTGETD